MNYAAIPKYKFVPPSLISELDFELAKGLQDVGSKKMQHLKMPSLVPVFKILGLVYTLVIALWILLEDINSNFPTSRLKTICDMIEGLFSIMIIATIYFFWGIVQKFSMFKNFNKVLNILVKKSNSYQEFKENYQKFYGPKPDKSFKRRILWQK